MAIFSALGHLVSHFNVSWYFVSSLSMGRVQDPVVEVPEAEQAYPPSLAASPIDPLGLGIVAENDTSSAAMPILIAGEGKKSGA
jgi:hypothetical protein